MIIYCPVSFLMYVHFDPSSRSGALGAMLVSSCVSQYLASVGYPAELGPVQSHVIVK